MHTTREIVWGAKNMAGGLHVELGEWVVAVDKGKGRISSSAYLDRKLNVPLSELKYLYNRELAWLGKKGRKEKEMDEFFCINKWGMFNGGVRDFVRWGVRVRGSNEYVGRWLRGGAGVTMEEIKRLVKGYGREGVLEVMKGVRVSPYVLMEGMCSGEEVMLDVCGELWKGLEVVGSEVMGVMMRKKKDEVVLGVMIDHWVKGKVEGLDDMWGDILRYKLGCVEELDVSRVRLMELDLFRINDWDEDLVEKLVMRVLGRYMEMKEDDFRREDTMDFLYAASILMKGGDKYLGKLSRLVAGDRWLVWFFVYVGKVVNGESKLVTGEYLDQLPEGMRDLMGFMDFRFLMRTRELRDALRRGIGGGTAGGLKGFEVSEGELRVELVYWEGVDEGRLLEEAFLMEIADRRRGVGASGG